jgi:hypothetical protein
LRIGELACGFFVVGRGFMVVNRGELCGVCVVVFVVEKHANFWRFIF